jgi:hypothetical protein
MRSLMKNKQVSIWHGRAATVWSGAVLFWVLSEALLVYVGLGNTAGWSMRALYLPIMISLPISVGVNVFRKVTRLPAIMSDDATIGSCSLYFAYVVLTANAVVFMCIADCLLSRHGPK